MNIHDPRDTPSHRLAHILFHLIWVGGLLIPVLLGIVARYRLEAQGVPVVSWSKGFFLIIPLVLWFEIPFVIQAFIARRVLLKTATNSPAQFSKWFFASVGSSLGLAGVVAFHAFEMLQYTGDGGLAGAVGMTLAYWPMTLPYLLFPSAAGAAVGGLLGLMVFWIAQGKLGKR